MTNAAGGKGERGDQKPSQQGRAGLQLQHALPDARVLYVSATGATQVQNLAYAQRLGMWGGEDFPFETRAAFVAAIEDGGVAAMEMLCRDLKSVGTYLARTISYGPTRRSDGTVVPESAVEYEPLVHRLTEAEQRQYDDISDLWSELLVAFEAAEQNACQKRHGGRYAQFYSAQNGSSCN